MKQICEYCRSRVERGRDDCKNCGAPVPQFPPEYNAYGSPSFVQDEALLLALSPGKHMILPSGQSVWTGRSWLDELNARCGRGNYGNLLRNDCGNIVGRR